MKKYYVNDRVQANGDHEVHHQDCQYLPQQQNRRYLGEFSNCRPAVIAAKAYYSQVNGCGTCSTECHTQ
jgi:ferredoxin